MAMRTIVGAGAAVVAIACNAGNARGPAVVPVGPAPTSTAPVSTSRPPEPPSDLPPPARAVDPSELAGDFACGPFDTKELEQADRPLLEDRLRVRFLPN